MATWPSCPQACMTSTCRPRYVLRAVEAKGSPCGSLTGKASMSARSATTGPGRLPRRMPTTPVRATPVLTSRPRLRRCSATRADVRCSWLPSSGWAWMSRRQAITLASCALACCATSCLRPVASVARAIIGLPHARASAIRRLRDLDGVMLAPLGPWQSSRRSFSSGRKTAPGFLSRTGEINSLEPSIAAKAPVQRHANQENKRHHYELAVVEFYLRDVLEIHAVDNRRSRSERPE